MQALFFLESGVTLPYYLLRKKPVPDLRTYPDYVQHVVNFVVAWLHNESHFTLYTSGSTGKQKPLLIHRKQLIISACMGMDFFRIPTALPLVLCLSVGHIAGMLQVVRALVYGHSLHVLPLQRTALLSLKGGRRYGLLSLVPLQLQAVIKDNGFLLNQCHTVLVGGGPLTNTTQNRLSQLHTRVYHSYGLTETVAHVALRRLHAPVQPYFEALPGVYIKKHVNGCLEVKSPATHRLVRTHDMVDMHGKRCFAWLGRADAVINSGGIKLYLDKLHIEITACWLQAGAHEDNNYFAYGLPDKQLGEKLVWFVEKMPTQKLIKAFKTQLQSLPLYHTPKSICVTDAFAMTSSGKVDKKNTAKHAFKEVKC